MKITVKLIRPTDKDVKKNLLRADFITPRPDVAKRMNESRAI